MESAIEVLGFKRRWIQLIMVCVKSISYSVLINGVLYDYFTPTRGIRQGDALSPYLFLLCAKVLSQMLVTAQQANLYQDMKLARNYPVVSHLLFLLMTPYFSAKQLLMTLSVWFRY